MPRRGEEDEPFDEDLDDEPSVDDDEDDVEEVPRRPPSNRPATRSRRRSASRPVRPWTISDLDEEEDDVRSGRKGSRKKENEDSGGFWQSLRRPVFFRARDSWYFEPLLALAIIVLLLVCLFAYTSNWPPVFVVESGSMQHGTADHVGLINTGDLILVKRVAASSIIPYVAGEQTGYSTYGEYGDVILYHPNGNAGTTPIIHRAILYLVWNPTTSDYSAPSLEGLPCGQEPGALYSISGVSSGCGWSGLISTITLYHVGFRNATVPIPLGALGHYSGFITMGDNNTIPNSTPVIGQTDQVSGLSGLVAPSWVVGVARGMLPWVGSFKLLLDGDAQHVPPQSWEFLALTISALVLAGFGLHYLFRVEGIEDPRRLAEERAEQRGKAEEDEEGPDWKYRPKGSRWKGLREWLAAPTEEEEEEVPPKHAKSPAHGTSSPPSTRAKSRGRPRPVIRKSKLLPHKRSAPRPPKNRDDDTL